jgi:hypothetical protein
MYLSIYLSVDLSRPVFVRAAVADVGLAVTIPGVVYSVKFGAVALAIARALRGIWRSATLSLTYAHGPTQPGTGRHIHIYTCAYGHVHASYTRAALGAWADIEGGAESYRDAVVARVPATLRALVAFLDERMLGPQPVVPNSSRDPIQARPTVCPSVCLSVCVSVRVCVYMYICIRVCVLSCMGAHLCLC